jgi:hypothetical protein
VTDVELATAVVLIVKVALLLPPGTVTLAGRLPAAESSLSVTTAPPLGAGPLKVTVPWEEVPPVTLAGFRVRVLSELDPCGATVSVDVLVTPR